MGRRKVKRKWHVDMLVAAETGYSLEETSKITSAFVRALVQRIAQDRCVRIDGLGRFEVVIKRYTARSNLNGTGPSSIAPAEHSSVHFAKSLALKQAIREDRSREMEKYGVDESVDQKSLEKAASQGCPKCGGEVKREGNLLFCKNCGSAPFEGEENK